MSLNNYKPTAKEVMNLRKETNMGVIDCKKSLIDSNGNVKLAKEILYIWSWRGVKA